MAKFTCIQATRLEMSPGRREIRATRCAAILVYYSVRDWTRFCYVIGSGEKGKDGSEESEAKGREPLPHLKSPLP